MENDIPEALPTSIPEEQAVEEVVQNAVPQEAIAPTATRSVKTFWERLDEVFNFANASEERQKRIAELIEQFPERMKVDSEIRSYIYQPDRISLSSYDAIQSLDVSQFYSGDVPPYDTQNYSSFKIRLSKPCLAPKSIQMLRCSMPTPVENIPNYQTMFFYYRIPSVGAPTYAPDYSQIIYPNMRMIRLLPSNIYDPNNFYNRDQYGWNRTFTDYQDLVNELNKACANDPNQAQLAGFYQPNDIKFEYDATFNKIRMIPTYYANGAPAQPDYYYIVAGYNDPNILAFQAGFLAALGVRKYPLYGLTYNLNTRLGYVWDGILPPRGQDLPNYNLAAANRMNPKPTFNGVPPGGWVPYQPYRYAESYPDLVNTGCVFIYLDFLLSSTEDARSAGGLLSAMPISSGNNVVSFYNNVINNPLTKVPNTITEFEVRFVDDSGFPFYLPNQAVVNLELAITYKE